MKKSRRSGLPGTREAWFFVWWTAAAGWVVVLCAIGQALLLGAVVDAVWLGQALPGALLGGLAGVVLVRAIFAGAGRLMAFQASAPARRKTRLAMREKILALGPARSSTERTGGLVHDAVEGVEALDAYYGLYLPQFLVGLSAPLLICLALVPHLRRSRRQRGSRIFMSLLSRCRRVTAPWRMRGASPFRWPAATGGHRPGVSPRCPRSHP